MLHLVCISIGYFGLFTVKGHSLAHNKKYFFLSFCAYLGDRCDIDINECDDDPCFNGATCVNTPGNYTCECSDGYEGRHCETADCTIGQCENGATCVIEDDPDNVGVERWRCDCVEFYEGKGAVLICIP